MVVLILATAGISMSFLTFGLQRKICSTVEDWVINLATSVGVGMMGVCMAANILADIGMIKIPL